MIRKTKIDSAPPPVKENLMSDIEAAIGTPAFVALVASLGGRQVYIPKTPVGEHHPLVQAAGADASAILIKDFAGETVMFPVTERKRAMIKAGLANGEAVLRIAQRVVCSPRFVWKVKAEISDTDDQAQRGLFD